MKNREKIKAVVFDMDGLMFDSERIVQYSWDRAGERMGFGRLGHHIYHTLGLNREKREAYFKAQYGQDFPFEKFLENYRKAFYEYVQLYGLPAKKGLHTLLEYLAEEKIPMAVATSSSREHALGNLKKEGIQGYFSYVISGNMVTEAKPSPEIYQRACEALKVPYKEALALEDSYNGIRSAYGAGMQVIMVPDLLTDSSCVEEMLTAKLDSLLEVRDWIASLR